MMHYVGMGVHEKAISYCVVVSGKDFSSVFVTGTPFMRGRIADRRTEF